MNSPLRRFIAAVQLAGGVAGLLTCLSLLPRLSALPEGYGLMLMITIAVYAVVLAAGVLLWVAHPRAQGLSILAQALTIPRLVSPALTVYFSCALDATVGLEYWWRTADPAFPPGASGGGWWSNWWLGSVWRLALGEGPPKVAVGINLVAVVLLVLLLRARRRKSAGPQAAGEVQPLSPSA